ncbi:MAG: hypothetical protein VW954_06390, partial [Alphaproteobacteria bacterium]
ILILAFFIVVKETAKKIKKFIDASSIKSIESAIKETDLMLRATINSTKKYNKFNMATKNTAFLKEFINSIFNNT